VPPERDITGGIEVQKQVAGDGGDVIGPDPRRTASWTMVAVAGVLAAGALLAQHAMVPFGAQPHMGLLSGGGDLDIYRQGALRVLHRDPLYTSKVPPGGWFTYPPFAALVFVPLAVLNFTAAKGLWMLVSSAALVATIWRCATTLGWRPDRRLMLLSVAVGFVALDVQAVRGTLWQGQVNLILMALILWDLCRPGDSRWRGWSVGVAAGVKLTAIVFVPYLLVTRQWRAAVNACGAAALTVGLSWLILPSDSAGYWLHAVVRTDRIGPLAHVGNYSVGGILANLSAPAQMSTPWWIAGVCACGALGFYAARHAECAGYRLLAVTIVGLLSCTVPPLAWGHHWVWVVPLLVVTLDRVARTRGRMRLAWAAATASVYLLTFMWFTAWVYREADDLAAVYPTHAASLGAAIDEMTKMDRLFVVAVHPVLFVIVACAAVVLAGRDEGVLCHGGEIRLRS
jgi:alpha-1,2-mannosyltransferase